MGFACIGVHYKGKTKIGIRLLDTDTSKVQDAPLENVEQLIASGKVAVGGLAVTNGKLVGSNGSLDRYPKIEAATLIGNKSPLVILYELGDSGYEAADWQGKRLKLRTPDVIKYSLSQGIANGKVVTRDDGTAFISAISGKYERAAPTLVELTPEARTPRVKPAIKANPVVTTPAVTLAPAVVPISKKMRNKAPTSQPSSPAYTPIQKEEADKATMEAEKAKTKALHEAVAREMDRKKIFVPEEDTETIYEEHNGITVEQRMTRSLLAMRHIRSFYYALLSVIPRIPDKNVKTMCVSITELYYSAKFASTLTDPQLMFAQIHEIMHIAMKHHNRRQGRKPKLWNIACDLYINKVIYDEFNIPKNGEAISIPGDVYDVGIQAIPGILYSDRVDIDVDTPETIYDELQEELNELCNQAKNEAGEQGEKQDGKEESKDNQSSSQDKQQGNGKEQKKDGSEQSSTDKGDSGEPQGGEQGDEQGDGNQGKKRSGSGGEQERSDGEPSGSGGEQEQEQDGSGDQNGDQTGGQGQGQGGTASQSGETGSSPGYSSSGQSGASERDGFKDVMYRGDKVATYDHNGTDDLVETEENSQLTDEAKEAKANRALERALVMSRQLDGKSAGSSNDFLQRIVESGVAPRVNWRTLLRNKLTAASQSINTYSRPDKRFISRSKIMPGPKKLENDSLENVKVCIDTSGSISNHDLGIAMAQIQQLLKQFHAKAEAIYWDTEVRAVYPFEEIGELIKKKPMGGGGTDVNCVFKHFESDEYKRGIKKAPSIILVFTDGEFNTPDKRFGKYRDTVWIIHNSTRFVKPFGVMAKLINT